MIISIIEEAVFVITLNWQAWLVEPKEQKYYLLIE